MFLSSLAEMTQQGLRGASLPRGRALALRAGSVYSMEMNDKIYRGMGEFVDFLHSLNRIPQKINAESVFYTKLLKEVNPSLVRWDAKTEVK